MNVPRLSRRFEDALVFAARLHAGDIRKGTSIPYLVHVLGTASLAQIREKFGNAVAEIVRGCTDTDETPKPPWRARKEAYVRTFKTPQPQFVWCRRPTSSTTPGRSSATTGWSVRLSGVGSKVARRARSGTTGRSSTPSTRRGTRLSLRSSTGSSQRSSVLRLGGEAGGKSLFPPCLTARPAPGSRLPVPHLISGGTPHGWDTQVAERTKRPTAHLRESGKGRVPKVKKRSNSAPRASSSAKASGGGQTVKSSLFTDLISGGQISMSSRSQGPGPTASGPYTQPFGALQTPEPRTVQAQKR